MSVSKYRYRLFGSLAFPEQNDDTLFPQPADDVLFRFPASHADGKSPFRRHSNIGDQSY
jgi:hypothetical protein